MKKIIITGANSYIGEAVREYLSTFPDRYEVSMLDTIGYEPEKQDFEGCDVVFNAAGIAHIKETEQNRDMYYKINRDLVVNIAKCAKSGGVKQFVLLSTMSVYGAVTGHITKQTKPSPASAYGISKFQADCEIDSITDDNFIFACLRPPMVYGKDCKGNYQSLRSFALKVPVFPTYKNERSMIYIGNLCEAIKNIIDEEKSGLFFPQNEEYVNTSKMVKLIAKENGKDIKFTRALNPLIKTLSVGRMKKVFGNLTYEKVDTVDKYSFEESIKLTEAVKE